MYVSSCYSTVRVAVFRTNWWIHDDRLPNIGETLFCVSEYLGCTTCPMGLLIDDRGTLSKVFEVSNEDLRETQVTPLPPRP